MKNTTILVRGGSWFGYSELCRSAYRRYIVPDVRFYALGFRVVCEKQQSTNISKTVRGGSWFYNPGYCRSATRNSYDAGIRYSLIGFRVVCDE